MGAKDNYIYVFGSSGSRFESQGGTNGSVYQILMVGKAICSTTVEYKFGKFLRYRVVTTNTNQVSGQGVDMLS